MRHRPWFLRHDSTIGISKGYILNSKLLVGRVSENKTTYHIIVLKYMEEWEATLVKKEYISLLNNSIHKFILHNMKYKYTKY